MVKIDKDKCVGCGKCAEGCPAGAIKIVDGKAEVDEKKCMGCGSCVDVCPVKAITVEIPAVSPTYGPYIYGSRCGFGRGRGYGRGGGWRRRCRRRGGWW